MDPSESGIRLRVSVETTNLIRHSHPVLKRRLKAALRTIIDDPMSGKALTHELQGLRSFRVGRIRVIYSVVSMTLIEIVSIGPRKSIYEETYKIISREN